MGICEKRYKAAADTAGNIGGNMEGLPLDCDCGCTETEEKNVYRDDIGGIYTPVEYDLHCKGCGKYLGHFFYGNWDF